MVPFLAPWPVLCTAERSENGGRWSPPSDRARDLRAYDARALGYARKRARLEPPD